MTAPRPPNLVWYGAASCESAPLDADAPAMVPGGGLRSGSRSDGLGATPPPRPAGPPASHGRPGTEEGSEEVMGLVHIN